MDSSGTKKKVGNDLPWLLTRLRPVSHPAILVTAFVSHPDRSKAYRSWGSLYHCVGRLSLNGMNVRHAIFYTVDADVTTHCPLHEPTHIVIDTCADRMFPRQFFAGSVVLALYSELENELDVMMVDREEKEQKREDSNPPSETADTDAEGVLVPHTRQGGKIKRRIEEGEVGHFCLNRP